MFPIAHSSRRIKYRTPVNLNILRPSPLLSPSVNSLLYLRNGQQSSLMRPLHPAAPPSFVSLLQLLPLPGIQHGSRNNTINLFSAWFSVRPSPPPPPPPPGFACRLRSRKWKCADTQKGTPTSCLLTLIKKIMKHKQRN